MLNQRGSAAAQCVPSARRKWDSQPIGHREYSWSHTSGRARTRSRFALGTLGTSERWSRTSRTLKW
jgi:hypothetical protein